MDEETGFSFNVMLTKLWKVLVEGSERLRRLKHFENLRNQASTKRCL